MFFAAVVSFMTKEKSNHTETSEDREIGNVLHSGEVKRNTNNSIFRGSELA